MKTEESVQRKSETYDYKRPEHRWEHPANRLVPAVKAEDLKIAWRFVHDTNEGRPASIASRAWQRILSEGADINAVAYRIAILGMLHELLQDAELDETSPEIQKQAKQFSKFNDDKLNDVLFHVMSQIRLYWLTKDGPTNGFPVDLEEFLAKVEQARPAS